MGLSSSRLVISHASRMGFAWCLYHPENMYAERNRMEAELCYEMIEALHEVIAYTYEHWESREALPWP